MLYVVFMSLCIAHLAEHIVQIFQLYVYGMATHESGGALGKLYPWLLHSEVLHYLYALFMLIGLWYFQDRFTGKARWWWRVALYVQVWHHFEHTLLLSQSLSCINLFGAAQPISVIQLLGFFQGTPEDNFGGLLTMKHFGACDCPGAKPGTFHAWTPWLFVIRRPEVHLLYNTLVTIPMVMAVFASSVKEIERGQGQAKQEAN